MKISTVLGARPQFIKATVVSRALAQRGVDERIVDTGQHYDEQMRSVFFRELGLPAPACSLAIGSGPHGAQTGRMLEALETVLLADKPDCVLVYGDTNSTLAGALAAAKLHIPVIHVEAGLRSFNREMPEEVNRVMADHLSKVLLTPTRQAEENLAREGITRGVHRVGDVMYDVALRFGDIAAQTSDILRRLELSAGDYLLATVHRAENTDNRPRLSGVISGFLSASQELPVIFPVHPRTRAALQREGLWETAAQRLRIMEPVGYLDMVQLQRHARLIVTDSGGVQKEAFFHRVPCVTLRDETEWLELVELGWNRLIPPSGEGAVGHGILTALQSPRPPEPSESPYGRGDAADRIAEILAGL